MSVLRPFSRLSRGLWFVPLACVVAGVALSLGTIAIDRAFDYELVPRWISGGPDAAMEILGTVAASMVSLAALVLTITMVVVQLAMGQFSPRIVQRILEDKPSQLAIGIFVGTFAHAILALREVQSEGEGVVPGLAVVVAFVLVIVSIMVLVWYVDHIGRSLRVSALIELVGTDTRKLLDALYTDHGVPPRFQRPTICAPRSGVITQIDHKALVQIAQSGDCVLNLLPALGEFVPAGAPYSRFLVRSNASTQAPHYAPSRLASSARSIRTWRTVCECSSTSLSGRCRTGHFLIRQRRCRRSIGFMTACVSWRRVPFLMARTTTRAERCG